jgi:hypothetical protein
VRRTTCRACGQPIPPLAQEHGDDWCSTRCCRRAHGVTEHFPVASERQHEAAQENGRLRRRAPRERTGFGLPVLPVEDPRELVVAGMGGQ